MKSVQYHKIKILPNTTNTVNITNVINDVFIDIDKFYDYSTVESYYNNEYISQVNNNNSYYNYVTNEYYGGASMVVNQDYNDIVNNYIYNNTYGGDTTNLIIINNIEQIPDYQPEEPPETEPPNTPRPYPTVPPIKSETEGGEDDDGGGILRWLFKLFSSIFDIFADILDFITTFFDKLAELIKNLLSELLTVEDDYFTNKIGEFKDKIMSSYDAETKFNEIIASFNEGEMSDITNNLNVVMPAAAADMPIGVYSVARSIKRKSTCMVYGAMSVYTAAVKLCH